MVQVIKALAAAAVATTVLLGASASPTLVVSDPTGSSVPAGSFERVSNVDASTVEALVASLTGRAPSSSSSEKQSEEVRGSANRPMRVQYSEVLAVSRAWTRYCAKEPRM